MYGLPLFLRLALLSVGGGLEDQPPPVSVANPTRKNNYASVDCGAKVIRHNLEAKVITHVHNRTCHSIL